MTGVVNQGGNHLKATHSSRRHLSRESRYKAKHQGINSTSKKTALSKTSGNHKAIRPKNFEQMNWIYTLIKNIFKHTYFILVV